MSQIGLGDLCRREGILSCSVSCCRGVGRGGTSRRLSFSFPLEVLETSFPDGRSFKSEKLMFQSGSGRAFLGLGLEELGSGASSGSKSGKSSISLSMLIMPCGSLRAELLGAVLGSAEG